MGASGFLGSHLVLRLVERGRRVRAFVRESSDCRVIAHLDLEWVYGDIRDEQSLADAMQGIDTVYHCIVDPRPWVRDVAALYEINVEGLKRALRVAEAAGVRRFVLTSSLATIASNPSGTATESDYFPDDADLPEYVRSRVKAERVFLDFISRSPMHGVACCVANTYGARDLRPTPQGRMVADASRGRMPFYWDAGAISVDIGDAAEGMILAEMHGRSGERYILGQRWVSYRELFEMAARAAGRKPRMFKVPLGMLFFSAYVAERVTRLLGVETQLTVDSIRCAAEMNNCSSAKARRELGWQPRPIEQSIQEEVAFFQQESRRKRRLYSEAS